MEDLYKLVLLLPCIYV